MEAIETKKRTRNLGAIYIEIESPGPGTWKRMQPVAAVGESMTDPFATVAAAERWISDNGQPDKRYRIIREVATFTIKTRRAAVRD